MRTFTAPSSSRSRLTVAWVATTPSAREQLDELALARDGLLLEQAGDPVLALGLRRGWPSALRSELGEQRPGGVHAVGRLLPHRLLGSVDHVGGDLLAAVGGQAVQEAGVGPGGRP